ncbi:hypothetical protein ES708_19596 [subsurface metagenome]
MEQPSVADWLKQKCQEEHLSLRKLAVKVGVSHVTITEAVNGSRVSADTIKKLARAFSGNGDHQKLALEDKLLALAGYRSHRVDDPNEAVGKLIDKISGFDEAQLELMAHFADFLLKGGR